jgi:hypothetical protein
MRKRRKEVRTSRSGERRGLYGQRPSRSHDDLRRAEFDRIRAMPARDRMLEALLLGDEVESFAAATRKRIEKKGGR